MIYPAEYTEPAMAAGYLEECTRTITSVHVHTIGVLDADPSMERIDAFHKRKKKPYRCIGYHFVIRKDGMIQCGRNIRYTPASVQFYNKGAIGMVFTGHGDLETWTAEQDAAGITLLTMIVEAYELAPKDILGHRELPGVRKSCPGRMINLPAVRLAVSDAMDMQIEESDYPTPEDFA